MRGQMPQHIPFLLKLEAFRLLFLQLAHSDHGIHTRYQQLGKMLRVFQRARGVPHAPPKPSHPVIHSPPSGNLTLGDHPDPGHSLLDQRRPLWWHLQKQNVQSLHGTGSTQG